MEIKIIDDKREILEDVKRGSVVSLLHCDGFYLVTSDIIDQSTLLCDLDTGNLRPVPSDVMVTVHQAKAIIK